MHTTTIRKYIDANGPITARREDGMQVTCIADPHDPDTWRVEEIVNNYISSDQYGFRIHKSDEPSSSDPIAGYYRLDKKALRGIDIIELVEDFAYQLRHLLPAVKAQLMHYYVLNSTVGPLLNDDYKVRVYGLLSPAFRQHARGSVFVCVTNDSGLTTCGHRIQGYMFHDEIIKFDSIQAWRMQELSGEALSEFDPEWANLVK